MRSRARDPETSSVYMDLTPPLLDMAENQEPQEDHLHVMDEEDKEANYSSSRTSGNSINFPARNYKWWILMATYIVFVLCGQSTATLLERLYYDKGGQSIWMAAIIQSIGFPVLFPFYFISSSSSNHTPNGGSDHANPPSILSLAMVYSIVGLLIATGGVLIAYGLMYLSVSTYSIIIASQLGFTAFFSFFLNSQKFTPFIINSIVLLTTSSILLAFQLNSASVTGVSKVKHAVGFICTVGASATNALALTLSQFFFRKVIKNRSFSAVLNMIMWESVVGSCAMAVGLFASKEWKGLSREMEGYELGKVSYVMTLVWSAICWQLFQIGLMGLIFEVSSLFSNVISALALPLIQVLAVIVFHDKMSGVKVVAMVLAIWGSVSYIYDHYLDGYKSKNDSENETYGNTNEVVPLASSL